MNDQKKTIHEEPHGKPKFKYTCIVDTPYALTLYLLRMNDGAVSQTRFFVEKNFPEVIFRKLPFVRRISVNERKWESRLYRFCFRLKCLLLHWRYVVGTQIFAQDHLYCASPLICGMNYTLMEDGPGFYCGNPPGAIIKRAFVRFGLWVLDGSIYLRHFGRNPQCENRWVTSADDARLYQEENRRYERFDVATLWKTASEEKRSSMLRLFGEQSEGIGADVSLESCRTILLTQPFVEDCGLTDSEMAAVYRPAVERYKSTGIVIKPHPRDKFNYERDFPDCRVWRTRIPMQLLCAFGLRFDRAITAFSTAISEFPEDTEIVWMGTGVNEKIKEYFGMQFPPKKFSRVVKC